MCDVNTQIGGKTQRSNVESHRPTIATNRFRIFVWQTHHKIWISFSHLSLLKCYHPLDLRVTDKNVHWPRIHTQFSLLLQQTHVASAKLQAHISQSYPMTQNINKTKQGIFPSFLFQLFHLRRDTQQTKMKCSNSVLNNENGFGQQARTQMRILLWIIIIINKDKQLKSTIHINGFIVWAHNFMVGCKARQKNEKELEGIRETEK